MLRCRRTSSSSRWKKRSRSLSIIATVALAERKKKKGRDARGLRGARGSTASCSSSSSCRPFSSPPLAPCSSITAFALSFSPRARSADFREPIALQLPESVFFLVLCEWKRGFLRLLTFEWVFFLWDDEREGLEYSILLIWGRDGWLTREIIREKWEIIRFQFRVFARLLDFKGGFWNSLCWRWWLNFVNLFGEL